jgi:TP901 family phage tail tape measure protein
MAIDLDVHGNTKPLEAAVQAAINRIRRQPIKITVDDKGATQPLGNMKRAADEFSKSMEAANARILAFGASMAIINGVADAFKGMVRNMVEVEKSMADINVVMGLSAQNLDKFGDGLFKVAKETGAAFRVAADAATEYARQGLSMEESLKRTRDALILTRLTGMDSAEAVKSLTAAMNTYGNQIKDTTQLVSKFAAVDVQFAVSAEDFAAAISRTGQAAKSAGVDIDELIGIVTSAQQQTARGGAVIGNALKTIFTKTGRTDTLNQLENLGIAVRDLEGNTIGAKRILSDLANTFDTLSEAQKAQITQTMGGLFHINILKAVLSDAAKQNGILARATEISSSATDEAVQKNQQLRETMSAMATETGLAIKQVSTQIGELMLAPGMEKILNTVKSLAEGASEILGNGESAGNKFATGFLKGIGNIITGPGLVVLTTVFVKLFMTAAKFTKESLSSLIGVTTEAQKQKAIQTSLVALIGQNAALGKEMLRTDISRTEKEKILLGLLKMQTAEAERLNAVSQKLAATLYTRGYGPGLTQGKRRAYGHIPNYADPERAQAAKGGYAAGSIRTMNMPGEGSVIYNSAETVKNFAGFKQPAIMPPQSSKAGKNYQQAFGSIHGFDPYAAGGYIPNFNRNLGGQKQGSLNAGGKDLVLLTGDQSGRDGSNIWYVGPNKSGAVTAYNSEALAKKRTTRFSAVEVPYFGLGTGDKSKIKSANIDEIDEKIRQTAVNQTVEIGKEFLKKGFKPEPTLKQKAERTFNNGAFSAAAGSTFESAMGAMLESDMFQDYSARTGTSLIDLPYSPQLFSLFGAKGKGRMGGEVKGGLEQGLQKSAAEKFYKVLGLKLAAFQYKKGQEGVPSKSASSKFQAAGLRFGSNLQIPGQARGVTAPGFQAAAEGFVPNFAAMAISRLGGLGKSKFGLAAVINSNPYFAQLLRRYGHWKNFPPQEKTKLNKFLLKQGFTNRTLQGYGLASMHSKSIGEGISNIAAAGGYIPNFADPLSDAIGREKAAGVPVSQIRVGSHSALMSKGNPLGLGVTNTHDEPNGLRDVFGANGFVPNYAAQEGFMGKVGAAFGSQQSIQRANEAAEKLAEEQKKLAQSVKNDREARTKARDQVQRLRSEMNKEENLLKENHKIMNDRKKSGKQRQKAAQAYLQSERKLKTTTDQFNQARNQLRSTHQQLNAAERKLRTSSAQLDSARKTAASRASRGQSGMAGMGLMMGLPMLAGFIPGADKPGSAGGIASGMMSGAATGAALGMIFPGWGTAIGAAVGALVGLVSSIKESNKAIEDEARARRQAISNKFDQSIIGFLESGLSPIASQSAENFKGKGFFSGYTPKPGETFSDMMFKFAAPEEVLGKIKSGKGYTAEELYRNIPDVQEHLSTVKTQATKRLMLESRTGDIVKQREELGEKWNQIRSRPMSDYDRNAIREGIVKRLQDLDKKEAAIISEVGSADVKTLQEFQKQNQKAVNDKTQQFLARPRSQKEILTSAFKGSEEKMFSGGKVFKELFGQEMVSGKTIISGLQSKTPEELEKLYSEIANRLQDQEILKKQENEAIILRLNKEKVLLSAQDKFNKDMRVSSNLLAEMNNQYDFELRTRGHLMTETEKAQNAYNKAINTAAAARYDAERKAEFGQTKKLITTLQGSDFEQEFKKELAAQGLSEQGFADLSVEDQKEIAIEVGKQSGHLQKINAFLRNSSQELSSLKGDYADVEQKAKNRAKTEQEITNELIKQKTGPGAMGRGMDAAFFSMREQVKTMDYELGKKIPYAFADGLANAMSEGLSGAKSIGDALRDSAISFLQMIQQAMLQKAAYSMVGAMGFSQGGNVRNYSRGGGVPAMVSNGEYVMGRDAVAKYGGSFMHGLNAGGKIPGYSNGGSALAANFGGGRGHASDRAYQSRAMSGFFYSQSGNVGLSEDTSTMMGILQEEERKRQEAEARRQAKKARRRQLIGSLVGIAAGAALSHFASKGPLTGTAKAAGYGANTPAGVNMAIDSNGMAVSTLPGADLTGSGFTNVTSTRSWNPMSWNSPSTINPALGPFFWNQGGGEKMYAPTRPGSVGAWFHDPNNKYGGPFRKYASGGYISGKSGIDQIPAMLSEGEYVIRASSARQLGKPMLDRINAGKFNEGGAVSELMGSSETAASGGNTNNINISINMERGSGSKKENQSQDNSGQNPADRSSDEQNNAQLAERIKQQVVAVIVEEQRPGGLLSE